MKSVPPWMTSWSCRSNQGTRSESIQDAKSGPWIRWSWQTNQKPSRSGWRPQTGLESPLTCPEWQQRSHRPGSTRTLNKIQQWIWCHHSAGQAGPHADPRPTLGLYVPSSHDCHRNLHLCHRTLHLEDLLPIQGTTYSNSISTSYAALGQHAPTSSCSHGRSHTHPEARSKQSGLVKQHTDPDQHYLHLRKTKRTFHGRTQKKGDILETIYIYMLML